MSTTLSGVVEIPSRQFGIKEADIKPENQLVGDLGCDSLDILEICFFVEDLFSVEIDDEELEQVGTVAQLVSIIDRELAK